MPHPLHPTAVQDVEAAIIGAGPAGLFAAFELGLLQVGCHIIDALPQPGGQPQVLYGDKPIYDIPALPRCTGTQLTQALLAQLAPFQPTMHLGQLVSQLQPLPDGRFALHTNAGLHLHAKAVLIAAGVGAFVPKRLKVPNLPDALEGRQLFHTQPPLADCRGQHVLIAGAEDAAVQAAIDLSQAPPDQAPASVGLLHRRDSLSASDERLAQFRQLQAQNRVQLHIGLPQNAVLDGANALQALEVAGPDGQTRHLPVTRLLVLQGFSPKLGPIADWHLALERKQLVVDTARFETSQPGIYAVGDINTYPGKRKLILCAFHEATLAAYAVRERVAPHEPLPFQYTTSSTRLHQLLGAT